jgi:putative N6-adenine-specific DNA methylase
MDTRDFIYREHRRFFAVVNEGLEELAAAELERLGAFRIRAIRRGVHFHAGPDAALDILFGSRLVGRILAPLAGFDCHSSKYMHRRAGQIPWEELIDPSKTFAVSATVVNSKATHSQYVSLVLKDAICDRMREQAGERPAVDRREPDLRAHVHLEDNFATVSVDLGDGSRHRRGYRPESGDAPLPETVAAALLELAQFDGTRPLLDPMCGSGTLLAEAFMRVASIPAGFVLQRAGARLLPGFGPGTFETARKEWSSRGRPVDDGLIRGNDIDRQLIGVAGENLASLPGGDEVRLRRGDFRDHPGLENGLIVCNPPWGIRIGDEAAAQALIRELGDFLKQKCRGSDAWLVLGNRELIKHVGLRAAKRVPVRIGGLDGRFVKYELY